ncbi:MAG: polymer-forming cytoskeletal protein [Acidobacteria bacterium]|nr:polymer-forming cytoskeletal protein [Acidobacteriota bacterium]
MGKGSKPEEATESTYPAANAGYQYGSENPNTVSAPTTDSENIARDIKEGKLSGFVGHGTSLTGDTTFQMMLRLDGHLTGTISSDGGTLIVGNNGQADANISVAVANINGAVNGDIVATDKVHLGRTAKVVGNVTTPKLVIEDGALFEGSCSMVRAREQEQKASSASAQSSSSYQKSSYSGTSSTTASTSSTTSSALGSASGSDSKSDTTDAEKKADAAKS